MRASGMELRAEAEAKSRTAALLHTRNNFCPKCGRMASLHIESTAFAGRYLIATACATWECCGQVGKAHREIARG